MFWTGFAVGIFVGFNVAVVVAGLLISAKRNGAQDYSSETPMDYEVEKLQVGEPLLANGTPLKSWSRKIVKGGG